MNENKSILVNRSVYNQKKFDTEFRLEPVKKSENRKAKILKNSISKLSPWNLLRKITILNLFYEYNFKEYLIPDIFSGLTVGVMQIPSCNY